MSIPKTHVRMWGASTRWTHDGLPHVVAGIDTWSFTMASNCTNEITYELAVGGTWTDTPTAASWWIGLNIKPNHAIGSRTHLRYEFVNLSWSGLASAWEHINVNIWNTSSVCVLNVGKAVRVECTVRTVGAGDCEGDTVLLPAAVRWDWLNCRVVHTFSCKSCSYERSQSYHWSHLYSLYFYYKK